ncbi:MAG: hypothetical protein O9294_13755 [Cytophagales bacterium]|jgi:hypothetical protein|nr:hypothetical protein [Cytophagales bacterium]
MDDRTKAAILIILTPIVIIIILIVNKFDTEKCEPIKENTRIGLARLYFKNSVTQIVLKNGRNSFDHNFDSLVITDDETLEIIRNQIVNRSYIDFNRYSPKWEIEIFLTVDTGAKFKIGLKKSNDNDETDNGYKIYFDEECNGNYKQGSRDLGNTITELIKNR